jgi:hypothetical protein
MTIECNDEHENALLSMSFHCECDSNDIDETDLQPWKHLEPRISTFRGMAID